MRRATLDRPSRTPQIARLHRLRRVPMSRRTTWIRCLVGVVTAGSLAYAIGEIGPRIGETRFDDAYMFLRYARHWLAGAGPSWNAGEGPVYAVTSFAHLCVVTAFRGLLSAPDPTVLTVVSTAAGVLAVCALTGLGFAMFPRLRHAWLPLLIVPALVTSNLFAYHCGTGMETTLALVANTALAWTALRFARQRTGRTLAWCVAAAWVAFLTRPDSGLHGLCLPPLLLLAHDRHRRDLALRYVVAFALVLLVDAAWKLAWFGNALPLPFFAKSSGFHDGYIGVAKWNAAHETLAFVRACLPFFVVMALAPSRDALSKLAAIGLPLVGTLAYFATVTQVMGWEARYYYPSIPFVVLGALIAADARFARAPEEPLFASRSAVFGVLGVAAVLGVLVSGPVDRALSETWQHHVITTPAAERPTRDYAMRTAEPVQELGWWGAVVAFDALLGRLPDDVVVAASEVGFIGAQHADMTLIDLSGLNDRQIAREGFAVSYVMAREPDLIWLPHGDYTGAVARLLDDDGFRERYLFFPFLYDFGVAVRRDGELTEGILGQLGAEVTRLYGGAQLPDLQAHPVD